MVNARSAPKESGVPAGSGTWWLTPVYRGEGQYGRRSTRPEGRDVISSSVPRLVTDEVWYAAQQALKDHRIIARNTDKYYLLKSVIRCGICGLGYTASFHKKRGVVRYRCNGQLVERGPIEGKCPAKSIKDAYIEPVVWSDIERFLRDPGDILEELRMEQELDASAAIAQAERNMLEEALHQVVNERKNALQMRTRDVITDLELDELLTDITQRHGSLEERLKAFADAHEEDEEQEQIDEDVLAEIRRKLDDGLTDAQKQEIVKLLVKRITIHTKVPDVGKKTASAIVKYRFASGVVHVCTGMDLLQPPT